MSQPQSHNYGKSLIVPSVLELSKQDPATVPMRYVRPDQDPPLIPDHRGDDTPSIPVVDVQALLGYENDDELHKLHLACQDWGFFQVVNHGVSVSLMEKLKTEITKMFELPMEEKRKLWQTPDDHEGFGQMFVVSEEQKLDWSDMFCLTTLPLSSRNTELLQKLPASLRETLEEYSGETKKLSMALLGQLGLALKMDNEEIEKTFGDGMQSMRMNYYPPCPEPEIAIGFTPHSDADALTILFQLNDADGLQIRKDGKWVAVKPLHDAFVINLGDMMEIISNGMYRSIEHRAVVNSNKKRLSVATFYTTNLDCELGPACSLIGPEKPPVFRRMPTHEYLKEFFARKLNGKSYLDFMRMMDPSPAPA